MADKLGKEGLITKLYNGFQLLMDKEKGVSTLESLRQNAAVVGLHDFSGDEIAEMVKEGSGW
ncbi:unnamed protein product [Linum tenue]|uniref:Uncharacterized protein n=1 Tax=Linum tenue TaxID=586396 RepID=A0AAV0R1Y7_9ROSI|nr:unnamed protein product [Linum tenue]